MMWQQTGIPCRHAYKCVEVHIAWRKSNTPGAVEKTNINMYNYVDKRLYQETIQDMFKEIPQLYEFIVPGEIQTVPALINTPTIQTLSVPTEHYSRKKVGSNKRIPNNGDINAHSIRSSSNVQLQCPCCSKEICFKSMKAHDPGNSNTCIEGRKKLTFEARQTLQQSYINNSDMLYVKPFSFPAETILTILSEDFLNSNFIHRR